MYRMIIEATNGAAARAVRLAAVVGAALAILSGCKDKASTDNVDRRVVERWNYLIAHQAEKAYDYLTPGARETQKRETYAAAMNSRPVQWKSVAFDKKDCDADRCKVLVNIGYSVRMPTGGAPVEQTSSQAETWILTDGDWYFLPK
jgi:hypothetical protein